MKTGLVVSAAGHALLIGVIVLGGALTPEDLPPPEVADVSVLSEAEFAALTRSAQAPDVSDAGPAAATPPSPSGETAPQAPASAPDTPPASVPAPPAAAAPDAPGDVPAPPQPLAPQAEVSDAPPAPPAQPAAEPETTPPEATRAQRPAPRVAPQAAPPPPPEAEDAPEVVERTTPAPTPEPPAEQTPPTAPEEAATEIVTEAEEAAPAPQRSVRPPTRPSRPATRAAAAAEPPADTPDQPAAAAAAGANGGASDEGAGTSAPLGEREISGLIGAIGREWSVDVGGIASTVTVVVSIELTREGILAGTPTLVSADSDDSAAVEAAFRRARTALITVSRSGGFDLPPEKYEQWQEIEITFNPDEMRLR